jgi:hypothetical protein
VGSVTVAELKSDDTGTGIFGAQAIRLGQDTVQESLCDPYVGIE